MSDEWGCTKVVTAQMLRDAVAPLAHLMDIVTKQAEAAFHPRLCRLDNVASTPVVIDDQWNYTSADILPGVEPNGYLYRFIFRALDE